MKINPGFRPLGKRVLVGDSQTAHPVQQKDFSELLRQHGEKADMEQLNRMIEEIHRQGERLAKSMTLRELHAYKMMVKRFLEETVRRGVGIKDTTGWDRRGRGRRYKLLDEIDRHLLEMADELLETEQGKIELLAKVGEIRGLLINFMF